MVCVCVCTEQCTSVHRLVSYQLGNRQFGHGKYQFGFLLCSSCEQARGTEHRSSVLDRSRLLGPQSQKQNYEVTSQRTPFLIFSMPMCRSVCGVNMFMLTGVSICTKETRTSACVTRRRCRPEACVGCYSRAYCSARPRACLSSVSTIVSSKTGTQLEKVLVMNTQARSDRKALAQAVPAMWIRCRYRYGSARGETHLVPAPSDPFSGCGPFHKWEAHVGQNASSFR